ncbi:transporter [Marinobacterium mangrovicola]|nr:transporter [Marinobacterium mangrovicola]
MSRHTMPTFALSAIASSLLMMPVAGQAAQIATDSGDYSPLPAGIDLGIIYYQHTRHDEFYASGDEISDLAGIEELKTDIGLLRWVHYIDVGGYIVDPQIIIPFGKVTLDTVAGSTSSSGVGDPIVGGTVWLYNNQESKRAFGLTALASIPIGQYDADKGPVNIGENRWKLITQAAYVTPLTETFSLELIGEYTFFGDNDDFVGMDREQDDQYGVQAHLSKSFGQSTKAVLSYYHDFGGESSLDGIDQDDELDNNRWQASLQHFITPDMQLQFQYGRSIDVENGFFEDNRFNFRFVKVF